MNLPKIHSGRRSSSCRRAFCGWLAGLSLSACAAAAPVAVDTELLLLVDISGSTTDAQFDSMMTAYGRAMTSTAVLDAIQSGHTGKIATSVMFFGGNQSQSVAVAWMEISDLSSASNFASTIDASTRPFMGRTAIGSAITAAAPLFGTETGGAENGFRSSSQIISVAGDGVDNDTPSRVPDRGVNVANARNAALAAGVDMISGVAINDRNGKLNDYYSTYVIGGKTGDTNAGVTSSDSYSQFEQALISQLISEIKGGAMAGPAFSAVPEPSLPLLASLSCLFLLTRRRR
jgi:hypothetical protein